MAMESLVRADIFFFITGVAVIVFASALVVLAVYLILISRDIRYILKIMRGHAEALHGGIERLKDVMKGWFEHMKGKRRSSSRAKGRESNV